MNTSTVRVPLVCAAVLLATSVAVTGRQPPRVPRLWTDEALKGWALPIAGVNAAPRLYTEAEYYAAPIDELRTYPVYRKDREPAGYRDSILKQGPRPLIDPDTLKSDADWVAAGREVFDGMDLAENRIDDPRAFAWVADAAAPVRDHALVTKDGVIVSMRWMVDRDNKLKLTLNECPACHTRVLPDGTAILGAQGNLNFRLSVFDIFFAQADELHKTQGKFLPPNESFCTEYAVPWLPGDVNARLKTMTGKELNGLLGLATIGTFPRFNGSPWFTNHMPDLIGVKDRKYLDATATHRNRGPEDIARYGILVTDADDGAIGPHRFLSDEARKIRSRHSDDAMLALGKYIYSLEPPANPNPRNELTARGEQVFTRSGCATCHTPPLYTNNKLVAVHGFVPFDHPAAPPAADVMRVRVGTDPGLALRTRKGTGYYKVPSLKGAWYRGPFEHSGSVMTLEDWFDPNRLKDDYAPTGWNPPGVKTRAVPGHVFGLNLPAEEKSALIAFLRIL